MRAAPCCVAIQDPAAPSRRPRLAAAAQALAMLGEQMRSPALAGRLRVDEGRAADMVRSAACGVVFILLEKPVDERDAGLSDATREAVIAAVVTDGPVVPKQPSLAPVATTLRALLLGASGLTEGERRPLAEWLDRMVRPAL